MKEIFSQVVEKEKDADSKIQDAKEQASVLLMNVEAEIREKIKHRREELQVKANEEIEAFTEKVRQNEERIRRETEERTAEELKRKSGTVASCAAKVFEILTGQQTGA